MGFAYKIQLDPSRDHWVFGWETGESRDRSLRAMDSVPLTLSRPGPTALIPPVYTYLVAGVFKLWGLFSLFGLGNLDSEQFILLLDVCASVFNRSQSLWRSNGGVGRMDWAFFPYSIALSNVVVWETSLTTLLLTLLVLLTLKLEHSKSLRAWVGYGLLWGHPASPAQRFSRHCPFWALGSGSVNGSVGVTALVWHRRLAGISIGRNSLDLAV